MRALQFLRANAAAYAVLLCMFCFAAGYQMRISLDTVHMERYLDFYVPFVLDSFTNRIDVQEHASGSALHRGDEVVAVNGHAFLGASTYLRALSEPNRVATMRSGSRVHDVQLPFPHCTCGTPSLFDAAIYWVAAPMFSLLVGFATAFIRPKSPLVWAFLGFTLSLSQLRFWPEWYQGFQETATPMVWDDWLRMPAVAYQSFAQHAWPASLLLGASTFYKSKRRAYRFTIAAAALFLIFAALEAILQLAWSEDFRRFVWLYRSIENYQTELMLVSMAGVAGIAWFLNRFFGAFVTGVAMLTAAGLYSFAAPTINGTWDAVPGKGSVFEATIPSVHTGPGFLALLFAVSCFIAGLIVVRREVRGLEVASLILAIPLIVHIGGSIDGLWYPFVGPLPNWPWFAMTSSGLSLTGLAWSVYRRTGHDCHV